MSEVIVYGQPACPGCNGMKMFMHENDISFEYIDISTDANARDKVLGAGFRSVPVVGIDKTLYIPDAAKVLLA